MVTGGRGASSPTRENTLLIGAEYLLERTCADARSAYDDHDVSVTESRGVLRCMTQQRRDGESGGAFQELSCVCRGIEAI